MKLLAVLVNYGTEQLNYLKQVVKEIRSFKNYHVTIVVHSNINTGIEEIDQEIIIQLSDNQMLPMTCRKTIWENRHLYDVFYFGENDHLLKERHIDKHLEYEKILPEDRISGLMQFELNENGYFYPAYHARYDWDYGSVEKHGGKLFAHFTNLHQATFILSKKQLLKIGELHDFTKFFDRSHYSVKCKVNTDIYQFCGMKKLICIDEFDENRIHHLPNIYINGDNGRHKLGSWDNRMQDAIKKLKEND